jgi:hypothetical protein
MRMQERLQRLEAHAERNRHDGIDPEAEAVEWAAVLARIAAAGPDYVVEGYAGAVPLIQRTDTPERAAELYRRTIEGGR